MSKTWEEFAKSIPGNKMTNFKTFGTTGSTGTFSINRRPYRSKSALLNQT